MPNRIKMLRTNTSIRRESLNLLINQSIKRKSAPWKRFDLISFGINSFCTSSPSWCKCVGTYIYSFPKNGVLPSWTGCLQSLFLLWDLADIKTREFNKWWNKTRRKNRERLEEARGQFRWVLWPGGVVCRSLSQAWWHTDPPNSQHASFLSITPFPLRACAYVCMCWVTGIKHTHK